MKFNSLIDEKKKQRVRDAIAKGDTSIFRKKKVEPSYRGEKTPMISQEERNSQLIQAVKDRNTIVVKEAIAQGADVNTQSDGWSVLHFIFPTIPADSESLEIVELLISAGADINAKGGPLGRTMLIIAAETGEIELFKLLVSKGADLEIKDDDSEGTALVWAVQSDNTDKVRLLIEKGADVNAKNNLGRTPLVNLSCHSPERFAETANLFIALIADVNAADKWGVTALINLAKSNKLEGIELLVSHGADVNMADGTGKTALSHAISHGHDEVAKFLKKHGAIE